MRYQQGAITLLITALLLVAILVLSLASYKNVFFQAKRAQNEIISRQQHWAAEGGLECAYSLAVLDPEHIDPRPAITPPVVSGSISLGYEECGAMRPNIVTNTLPSQDELIIITATEANTSVNKIIKMPKAQGQAAITANADMIFLGDYDVQPNPISKDSATNEYECLSVNYSQKFTFLKDKYSATAEYHTIKPYDPTVIPANAANTVDCKNSYKTNMTTTMTVDGEKNTQDEIDNFKNDFLYTDGLDPFQKLFGVARGDFKKIKSKFEVISNPINCATSVNSQISASKELIWVEGNCDISTVSSSNTKGIILVVQNGLLAINGAVSFHGVLYHFINDPTFTPISSNWSTFGSGASTSYARMQESATEAGISVGIPSAIIQGAALPQGTLIIDTPNNLALIDGSAVISFDQQKIEHPLGKLLPPKWLKGSWHDF